MKRIFLVMAIVMSLGACRDKQEKTLSTEPSAAPAPVVVQKEIRYVNAPATQTTEEKKKGWSKAAKSAVIGAGSGAVVGAIVSDKKGKGAIIGGAVGAGAGYIIGRDQDKKDGRVK